MLSGARHGQAQAGLQGQGLVHLPGGPQAVPLGDGPPGIGQHVHPVLQGLTGGTGTQHHLTHGLGPEPRAPSPDGQHQVHTLGKDRQRGGEGGQTVFSLASEEGLPALPSGQPTWTWLNGTWKVKASLKYGSAVLFLPDVFLVFHFLWLSASWTFT